MEKRKASLGFYCGALLFCFYFTFGIFGSMLTIYLSDLGKTPVEIAFVLSASGIFAIALQPVVGFLDDRIKNRKALGGAILGLAAVAALCFTITRQTWLLFLLDGLVLSGMSSLLPIFEKIATSGPYRYGSVRIWGSIGFAAASQLGSILYAHVWNRSVFFAAAAALLLTIFFLSRFSTASMAQQPEEKKQQPKDWNPAKALLGSKTYLLLLLLAVIFAGLSVMNETYLSLFLTDSGFTVPQSGLVLSLAVLMEIPLLLFSHRYMDGLSGKQLLFLVFGSLGIQFAGCWLLSVNWIIAACVVLLRAIGSNMLFVMVTIKITAGAVDEAYSSTALGIVEMIKSIGTILFQAFSGFLVKAKGFAGLYAVATILAAAGLVICLLMRTKPQAERALFSGSKS